ncbi:hypothetical protein MJD09_01385, partial [bacterium]|nr:hypothetical protein [bacterium]
MKKIALATSRQYPNLTPDDQLLIPALRALGIQAEPAVWDSNAISWSHFDAIIIRSCWDYHKRLDEFLGWVAHLQNQPT